MSLEGPLSGSQPIPIIVQAEDPDLQELTAQEIAEAELAEAMWPQKELAAHLCRRYGDGESAPGMDPTFEEARKAAEARALERNAAPRIPILVPKEEKRPPREHEKSPTRIRQVHQTPHVDRMAEIIRKAQELRAT